MLTIQDRAVSQPLNGSVNPWVGQSSVTSKDTILKDVGKHLKAVKRNSPMFAIECRLSISELTWVVNILQLSGPLCLMLVHISFFTTSAITFDQKLFMFFTNTSILHYFSTPVVGGRFCIIKKGKEDSLTNVHQCLSWSSPERGLYHICMVPYRP